MFRWARSDELDLSATLAQLPTHFLTFVLDGAWLVVGPTGVFVVTGDEDGLDRAVTRVEARAIEMRAHLSNELDWVPFVDALVVSAEPVEDHGADGPATVLPADLVISAITSGRQTVDDETLMKLTRIGLRRGS